MGTLPPIKRAALLLDLDGTLLDFAPTPDAVVVPAELPDVLRTLRQLFDDAVAVVTGRPVETIDRLLGDMRTAGASTDRLLPPELEELWETIIEVRESRR